ncbi:M56 family metallopeptidase [Flavobacterium cellulosilyticum]|uniref:M56 family peptidase n=1 Tax=Flavobacterium cellulosilyticum TaxID=2541731 RepID=A0A4R5CJE0_9FLAO|nr:M56 family metallopeptidase [Flavobacterium cellulosilyticum]TDD97484.1 M56 family peptidase [Flavobacterium cellulosilyticum]
METLLIYSLKSNGLIGMFFLAYYILLRKETFFNSNRWFLLLGLITSVVLPLVVFTKTVWVKPIPNNFDWSKIPVATPVVNETLEINWYLILAILYLIGIVLLTLKFVFDFRSLHQVLKGKTIQHQADYKLLDVTKNVAPFTYFNYIVYNSSLYSAAELANILEHEKVHSTQNHTVDVLISRLFCIAFWFNPFMWLYKKAIIQNLEFIADSEASKNIADKKAYQLTLLKITTQQNCVAITNHFFQSLIKKRIVMLNKNQSKKRNYWKYVAVLPALIAFVFLYQIRIVAQEKESTPIEKKQPNDKISEILITKNTTDEELKNYCEKLKKSYNIDLSFFNIKRNTNGEIINIESKNKNKNGKGSCIQSGNPIKPFKFFYDIDNQVIGYVSMDDVANLSKGKEIYINGKKSTEEELAKINPNAIKSIAVNKEKNKPSIEIDTENSLKRVKITDKDIYIDGVKSTNDEFSKLDKNTIDKVDVNTFKNTVRITTKDEKPIIILNGTQTVSNFKIDDIPIDQIVSVNVLKDKFAEDKYGDKGKNGVIEITTKETNDDNSKELQEIKVVGYGAKQGKEVNGWKISAMPNNNRNTIEMIKEDKNIDYKKAIIIIDGKLSNFTEIDKLNPKEITRVLNHKISEGSQKEKDAAVQKFGNKALNGIIEIETKGFSKN